MKLILHLVSKVNSGQGPITELFPLVGFQNLKCILLNNFYVCGPTSVNLIPHLVSKVRMM